MTKWYAVKGKVHACSHCGSEWPGPEDYRVCGLCQAIGSFIYMSRKSQMQIQERYQAMLKAQTETKPMSEEERQAGIRELWP